MKTTSTLTLAALSLASMALAATAALSGQPELDKPTAAIPPAHILPGEATLAESQHSPDAEAASWTSVPEPRAAALGVIGMSILLLKRRK